MPTLSRDLRKLLEKTVLKARRAAEGGARKSLEHLAVGEHESFRILTPEQRRLRSALRAHAKNLGDTRYANGKQEIERLVTECAYEQWHRLLFARFLAENSLLIEPESGVAISVDECRELAATRGVEWRTLAGEFAERMLPQIFRQDDPVLEVVLPPESRAELEELLDALPPEVFTADDSLGWTYQFWQSEAKDAVNASGVKIGADQLPAVTQLFTEDYMVLFLLHNTLGAWWAAKRMKEGKSHKIPGYDWTYLRFNDDGSPAAGAFEGWPRESKDVTVLDPCMGSGHFLVFALPILVAFRMEEEGLSPKEAVCAVLRDNLFGLELDQRCTQIAAFNLALAAWKIVGYRILPQLNLACSGIGVNARKEEWVALAGDDEALRNGMAELYDLFKQAPILGSLINPTVLGVDVAREQNEAFEAQFKDVRPMLDEALAQERSGDDDAHELAVTAQGVVRAADVLARKFTLVATNVPYLGRGRQEQPLKEYCERAHPQAKSDLASCFIDRCVQFSMPGGSAAAVTPQAWMFQDRYVTVRKRLLVDVRWTLVAQLGVGAFDAISGERVNVAMLVLTTSLPPTDADVFALDVSAEPGALAKSVALKGASGRRLLQESLRRTPDARIVLDDMRAGELLMQYANSWQGIKTSDDERFTRMFWEFPEAMSGWHHYQRAAAQTMPFGGREEMLYWENGYGSLTEVCQEGASFRGRSAWGKRGVAVSMMGSLPATIYSGEKFAADVSILEPKDIRDLPAVWAFCSSPEYAREVRRIDRALRVTNSAMAKIPFDVERWRQAAERLFSEGLPTEGSSDPTQWLFHGHPRDSDYPLHVAAARLVSYRWQRQTGWSFPGCPTIGADGLEHFADADGIVPLAPLRGEPSGAERLRTLLIASLGADWSPARERELLAETGSTASSLDEWLRDDFFAQHCTVFHQRPFIWHVWDGRVDGFHALVNYHKLAAPDGGGRRMLEALTFTYLGDWIERQRADVAANVAGADARLAAAVHLQGELQHILDGEPPYDIFVRWKPLAEQPIGWEPDINDGVRVNIRPFMTANILKARGKAACILRTRPKGIKWGPKADRGTEPPRPKDQYPWFWSWDQDTQDFMGGRDFDGKRWNDLHYANSIKQKARASLLTARERTVP